MLRIIFCCLLICISLNSITAQTSRPYEEFYKNGAHYLASGELDVALAYVNKAIELNPNRVEGYVLRFMLRNRINPEDDNLTDCNRIIELAPSAPGTDVFYLARANVRLRQLDWKNAFNDLNQAVSINPQSAVNYNVRAYSYLLKDDLNRARADYEKSLELDPAQPSPFVRRAYQRWNKKDFEGAISDYSKAIEWKPDYAAAYAVRGIVHGLHGNVNKAISDIRKAMALDPQAISDSVSSPFAELDQFLKYHPSNARAYEVRGIFRLLQSKDKEATSDFNKSLELDPSLKSEIDRITTELSHKKAHKAQMPFCVFCASFAALELVNVCW